MNYETAIALAHQRMREIGKQCHEYHIEPVYIIGTATEQLGGEITVRAYNEYYYLVNYEKYFGLQIFSDVSYFNADDLTYNTIPQEFTGLIRIVKIPFRAWSIGVPPVDPKATNKMIPVEFLKVTIH